MGKPKPAVHAIAAPSRGVPLELAPLLKPYRKHGKLSLRVERVQQLARLSRGRNNGDGSWSLGTDELDDLEYLFPEGSDATHTLAIRIIGVEQDLATLAVLDFQIGPGAKQARRSQDNDPGSEAQRQFEEVESLKAALGARVAELAELQGTLYQTEQDTSRKILSAVEAARASWKEELEQHLASAAASGQQQSPDGWQTEKTALLHQAKEREEKRVAEARERWRRETDDAKAAAERAWKAAEAARLAKAEADWREKSAKTLAEMQARLERSEAALADVRTKADAVATTSDRDGRRLLDELASVRAALAAREDELVRTRMSAEEAQSRLAREAAAQKAQDEAAWKAAEAARFVKAESEWRERSAQAEAALKTAEAARFAKAESEWREKSAQVESALKAVEAARFARAESEWREKSAQVLQDAKTRGERAESLAEERTRAAETAKAEHRQLAEELKMVRSTLADRESELARTRSSAQEGAATATKADRDERNRLTSDLADIRAKLAEREAELARVHLTKDGAAAAANADADERRRLAAELAGVRTTLAAREADLARLRADNAQQQKPQDVEAAVAKAKAEWKEAERSRLAAAEAEWRKESSGALAAATARSENAEKALARAKIETQRSMGDAIVQGLHDEISGLRRALADRESELAQIRAKEPRVVTHQRITIKEDHGWNTPEPVEPPRRSRSLLLAVQIAVIIILVVTGIIVGPNFEQYIPESVWNMFGYTRLPEQPVVTPPTSVRPSENARTDTEAQPMATILRDANVHATPGMTGDVVTTAQRGTKVAVIGQHGNWTRIRIEGGDNGTKPLDGWIYNTFLAPQDNPPSTGATGEKP